MPSNDEYKMEEANNKWSETVFAIANITTDGVRPTDNNTILLYLSRHYVGDVRWRYCADIVWILCGY